MQVFVCCRRYLAISRSWSKCAKDTPSKPTTWGRWWTAFPKVCSLLLFLSFIYFFYFRYHAERMEVVLNAWMGVAQHVDRRFRASHASTWWNLHRRRLPHAQGTISTLLFFFQFSYTPFIGMVGRIAKSGSLHHRHAAGGGAVARLVAREPAPTGWSHRPQRPQRQAVHQRSTWYWWVLPFPLFFSSSVLVADHHLQIHTERSVTRGSLVGQGSPRPYRWAFGFSRSYSFYLEKPGMPPSPLSALLSLLLFLSFSPLSLSPLSFSPSHPPS